LEPAPLQAYLQFQLQLVCASAAGQVCGQAHQLVDHLVGWRAGRQLSPDPVAGDPIVADREAPYPQNRLHCQLACLRAYLLFEQL
jgi:hypothetical protein